MDISQRISAASSISTQSIDGRAWFKVEKQVTSLFGRIFRLSSPKTPSLFGLHQGSILIQVIPKENRLACKVTTSIMGSRKRARREGKNEKTTLGNDKLLYDNSDKDSEEEDLENILFGTQPSRKTLSHPEDEILTGLEHVPDSEVRSISNYMNSTDDITGSYSSLILATVYQAGVRLKKTMWKKIVTALPLKLRRKILYHHLLLPNDQQGLPGLMPTTLHFEYRSPPTRD